MTPCPDQEILIKFTRGFPRRFSLLIRPQIKITFSFKCESSMDFLDNLGHCRMGGHTGSRAWVLVSRLLRHKKKTISSDSDMSYAPVWGPDVTNCDSGHARDLWSRHWFTSHLPSVPAGQQPTVTLGWFCGKHKIIIILGRSFLWRVTSSVCKLYSGHAKSQHFFKTRTNWDFNDDNKGEFPLSRSGSMSSTLT